MHIDLRECDTAIINLPDQPDRRARMTAICNELGLRFRFVDGLRCSPPAIGCGLSHYRALKMATDERPLLLLEDDLGVGKAYAPIVAVPEDTDAIYAGISSFGALDGEFSGGWEYMAYGEPITGGHRILNMLGSHAILYVSAEFRRAAADAMVEAMAVDLRGPDYGLTRLQPLFNVYSLDEPLFYQAAEAQGSVEHGLNQERATKDFRPWAAGSVFVGWFYGQQRRFVLEWIDGVLAWRLDEEAFVTSPG